MEHFTQSRRPSRRFSAKVGWTASSTKKRSCNLSARFAIRPKRPKHRITTDPRRRETTMKTVLPVSALLASATIVMLATPVLATPDKPVIALSNAYYGNTWRHQMVEAFEAAAKQAKDEGKI